MPSSPEDMLNSMIKNMPEKTGKTLEAWLKIVAKSKLEKHGEIMKLLKGEHGMTHGYANAVSMFYRQQQEGGPKGEDDLVAAQYAGAKADLKPIYDKIVKAVEKFGKDVDVSPRKTYVSLRRNKQFGIIKAATKSRIDLGITLKDTPTTDRLTTSKAFGDMCPRQVQITSAKEVDKQVVAWLKEAYENC